VNIFASSVYIHLRVYVDDLPTKTGVALVGSQWDELKTGYLLGLDTPKSSKSGGAVYRFYKGLLSITRTSAKGVSSSVRLTPSMVTALRSQ
jgi:hypothetical protein